MRSNSASNNSSGVRYPRIFLGSVLAQSAMYAMSSAEYPAMLTPFGMNLRSSLLWHSFVPFSQEEYGCVK